MEVVLNFKDAVLYERDLLLFDPPGWLNDACLNLGFRLMEQHDESVVLMDPAVYAFMMLQCDDPQEERDLASNFENKRLILVPINDASDFSSYRGSHWSLLAYYVDANRADLHDSYPGSNHGVHAARALAKLRRVLRKSSTTGLRKVQAAAQTNGYDCGAFVLATARLILLQEDLQTTLTPAYVTALRAELALTARRLAEEYRRGSL